MDISIFALDWIACLACLGAAYGGLRFLTDVIALTRHAFRQLKSRHDAESVGGVGGDDDHAAEFRRSGGHHGIPPVTSRPGVHGDSVTRSAGEEERLYPQLVITGGKLRRMSAIKIVELLDSCEFTSGIHAGKLFLAVHQDDPNYDKWILNNHANSKKEIFRLYVVYATLQRVL